MVAASIYLAIVAFASFSLEQVRAADYNETKAIEYATLAGAAYCPKSSLQKWNCGDKCTPEVSDSAVCTANTHGESKVLIARRKDICVVSFEGSNKWASFLQDLLIEKQNLTGFDLCGTDCMVHQGYYEIWQSVEVCVWTKLIEMGCPRGSDIAVTGHSLGAGVSAIAMMRLEANAWNVKESFVFGMPRTGNLAFTRNFTAHFAGRFWRVTHHSDPIVQLPPDKWGPWIQWEYKHVEPEVFYDDTVNKGYVKCVDCHDMNCSHQYWDAVADLGTIGDHLDYMGVQTGTEGCPSEAIELLV